MATRTERMALLRFLGSSAFEHCLSAGFSMALGRSRQFVVPLNEIMNIKMIVKKGNKRVTASES